MDLTELVFILDKSGSMYGLESDTIGGYNSVLKEQKDKAGDVIVSTVLFNDKTEFLHKRAPIKKVKPLKKKDYRAGGTTALLDAIGNTISMIDNKQLCSKEVPDKTLFVITTDGYENASKEYSSEQIKTMVENKKKQGWDFIFLGANIDAFETAGNIGIGINRTANFHNDSKGVQLNYKVLNSAISSLRNDDLDDNWASEINMDYENRKE